MDIVTILRELSRRRILVAGVGMLAILIGAAIEYQVPSFQSRHYDVGVATTYILVDTPSSQVVNVSPRGSDTTAARASLLASLMIDGEIKTMIAQRAQLRANQLVGTTSAATNPSYGAGGATAPPSAPTGPYSYSFSTSVPTDANGNELPIIALDTQAPTAADATRLANAAVASLSGYLNTKAASEGITDANRLQVTGMGAPQSTVQSHGPSSMIVILVVLIVFLLGCAGILGVQAVARGWREAADREQVGWRETPARDRAGDDPWPVLETVPSAEESSAQPIGAEEPFPGVGRPAAAVPVVPSLPTPGGPFPRLVQPSSGGSGNARSDRLWIG